MPGKISHARHHRLALPHRARRRRQRSHQPHHAADDDERCLRLSGQGHLPRARRRRYHALLLHGSANMIGGQAVVIKHKYGATRDEMLFPNAPALHQIRQRRESQARLRRPRPAALHPHGQLRRPARRPGPGAGLHARVGRLQRQRSSAATKTPLRPSTTSSSRPSPTSSAAN